MERREGRQITIEELMPKFYPPKPGLRVDGLGQAMIEAQDLGHPDLQVVSMDDEGAIVKQKGKTITLKEIDGDFRITDLEFLVEGVMPAKKSLFLREWVFIDQNSYGK